jgi:hypothetical protein
MGVALSVPDNIQEKDRDPRVYKMGDENEIGQSFISAVSPVFKGYRSN